MIDKIIGDHRSAKSPARVSVVVPTYREAENLPELVPRIAKALGDRPTWEVVVVDDDSRDGTDAVCAELAARYPVRLITRIGERGLATAVVRGLRGARGNVLVVMDADLSHPPESIPALVARIEQGADFVVGSRYMAGGGIEDSWGIWRKCNSRVATWLARALVSVSDPMSGFFALRREVFERAEGLCPKGYKIGLELMVKGRPARIEEVPITFHLRRHGESKLSMRQRVEYLQHVARLYAYRWFPRRHGAARTCAGGSPRKARPQPRTTPPPRY